MTLDTEPNLVRKAVAELIGTAMLLAAVVGSGIMAERLADGNVAVALLGNSIATGTALAAIILTFGRVSGAHLNPIVTLSAAAQREIPWREVTIYIGAQVSGALLGVAVAHTMFGLPVFFASNHVRKGFGQLFSEMVASFGLIAVIRSTEKQLSVVAAATAAYITAAYWFTASTSFANPAVTLARAATDTFAGIRPVDVPGFILAQVIGATASTVLFRWLLPVPRQRADAAAVRHELESKYGR